jgi:fermentation-respiration switch protein FrsA (DUF1100 family)
MAVRGDSLVTLTAPSCVEPEPKELLIVPAAGHVVLYDRVNLIPFEKLTPFSASI